MPATGVTFSDTPDPDTTTLLTGTVQTSKGTVITGNNASDITVFVEIGDMPAGPNSEVVISFQVTINDPLPAGVTQVENQGVVDCDQPDFFEFQAATNVTAAPVLVASKAYTLTNDPGTPGDTLFYTVTITNTGNAGAPELIPLLRRHAEGPDELLAEHARWALARLS